MVRVIAQSQIAQFIKWVERKVMKHQSQALQLQSQPTVSRADIRTAKGQMIGSHIQGPIFWFTDGSALIHRANGTVAVMDENLIFRSKKK
jgi:hypothetical protein